MVGGHFQLSASINVASQFGTLSLFSLLQAHFFFKVLPFSLSPKAGLTQLDFMCM